MSNKHVRLYGGHRNDVFRTDGKVKIVWKEGFKRQEQIREGVLLENFVAVHTDIKSRMLVDKSKPIQEEGGKLVTYFHYAAGEIRYPWNLAEIASAAKLLTKLHQHLKAWPCVARPGLNRQLHLDYARGNVLFKSATNRAIGIIDFETTTKGPVEQELGRSLSFILVDTPGLLSLRGALATRQSHQDRHASLAMTFQSRLNFFLTNYSLPFRRDKVINWTLRYLTGEDYGDLNLIRNQAVSWLQDNNLTIKQFNN